MLGVDRLLLLSLLLNGYLPVVIQSVSQFSNIKKRGVSVFVHHEEEDY